MKKILISMLLCLSLFTGISYAEETKPFQWFDTDLSVEVDAHYFLNRGLAGRFGGGVAVEFAQLFENTVGIRGELVVPDRPKDTDTPDKLGGLGATAKIHNAINKLGGKTIVPKQVQIGLSALVDITHGLDFEEIKKPYLSLFWVGISFK